MRLGREFFERDALVVAPELLGKALVTATPEGAERRLVITETEAYRGEEDTACHAHRGRTKRTEMLYRGGGAVYVYLCYGIHWLMNVITGPADFPRACSSAPAQDTRAPGNSQNTSASPARSTARTSPPPRSYA